MKIERLTVALPAGFDPSRHGTPLLKKVAETHGDGWEIDHIDPESRKAVLTRQAAVIEVTETAGQSGAFEVKLAKGTKPADADRVVTRLEAQHQGSYVTRFEPYLGFAELTPMDRATSRCRGAVAVALGVKPWMVQITPRSEDDGWDLKLPDSYVPSKHDDKLTEVAEAVVGNLGWSFESDPRNLTASIIPGEPPTFPPAVPYPFDDPVPEFRLGSDEWANIPLGVKLSRRADIPNEQLNIDLEAAPHTQVSGTSGSGKSQMTNAFIAGVLARGCELVVVDLPAKAVDFLWCKRFVRDGGWGCENLPEAVTALALVYEEGERRARLLAEHHVTKWTDLPSRLGLRPIVVIVDEVTGLFYPEEVPKGLPKDHPLVVKPTEVNLLKATLKSYIARITAEMRFVGIKVVLSSQVSSTTTGVPTSIRLNLGHKILLGTKPTDNNRRLALSDAGSVPKVPAHIAEDDKASRGVGVAEFEGQEPCVFKGYFATTSEYSTWLDRLGVAVTERPRPTASEVARHTPSLEESVTVGATSQGGDGGVRSRSGSSVSTDFAVGELCATCGGPVDPLTAGCRCTH